MSIKSNVVDAVIYMACSVPLVILIVLMLWFLADHAKVYQPVANEVANKVTNTETNIVTEAEVYKIVCTVDGEGYCKEYSVRKITRE